MQYRPFWFKIFDPRLTGRLIAVIIFLFLIALSNVFSLFGAVSNTNIAAAGQHLLSVLLYALPAFGLMKLNRWARLFEIGYSLLMVALGFIILFGANIFTGTFIVVTHGLVGIVLLSAKTRELFNPPPDVEETK